MSDEKNKHRGPFEFLKDMKEKFLGKYTLEASQKAIAFSFNEEFSKVICERMAYYNGGVLLDSINELRNKID